MSANPRASPAQAALRHDVSPDRQRASRTASADRLLFIDNLRWTMIILVISMHAADTYSPLGSWYFVQRTKLGIPTLLTFAAWQMYLQAFFMGLLFFIAGYFVPQSLARKGRLRFVRDRAFRLGLPVLFYMLLLGPVTEYYVAHSWSAPGSSFIREWWLHIIDLEVLSENGPLWFCLALLIFSLLYAALPARRGSAVFGLATERPPATGSLIGLALAMAASTFLVRLLQPANTTFLNMHLGDFPQYVLLFSAGVLTARQGWLPQLSFSSGMRWLAVVLPAGFAVWLTILYIGGGLAGNTRPYLGGWYWQSAAINLWESFTCVALSFGLLVLFRDKFPSQGPVARFLSANAFGVYVFHPPIVIICALVLYQLAWSPLVKFAILTAAAVTLTFALSGAVFRQIPLLRTIL
jgi:fucose 4-O-acetylase-like acetyltransferase